MHITAHMGGSPGGPSWGLHNHSHGGELAAEVTLSSAYTCSTPRPPAAGGFTEVTHLWPAHSLFWPMPYMSPQPKAQNQKGQKEGVREEGSAPSCPKQRGRERSSSHSCRFSQTPKKDSCMHFLGSVSSLAPSPGQPLPEPTSSYPHHSPPLCADDPPRPSAGPCSQGKQELEEAEHCTVCRRPWSNRAGAHSCGAPAPVQQGEDRDDS